METVEVYGLGVHTSIHLTGDDPEAAAAVVRQAWSRCLEPQGGEREARAIVLDISESPEQEETGRYQVSDGEPAYLHDTDIDSAMCRLTQSVTVGCISVQTGDLLMMHAGAVGNPATGGVFAYAATGGTGKTTLSRLLGRQWGYVTDETLGVDPQGHVIPYPKPLSVRPDSDAGPKGAPRYKNEFSPDVLGLERWPSAAGGHLIGLALIGRDSSLTEPVIEELDTMTTMVELAPETSALSSLPSALSRLATLLDSAGTLLRITYSEGSDIEPLLSGYLREKP